MPKITMVFGRVGAGKTTLARRLEAEGAVRLSLDEWTIAASGDNAIADWEVVERVLAQLMRFWPQVVAVGGDVVLDLAFWKRSQRDEVRQVACRIEADVELLWVRCEDQERRRRCMHRSNPNDGSYMMDEGSFDWIEQNRVIEEPGSDEEHIIVDTTSG